MPVNQQLTDISSNHLTLLAWVLEREGLDTEKIFAEIGVEVPSTNSPNARVPMVVVIRLLEQIQKHTQDPSYCLKLYQHMKLTHLNVLGFALSCSSNLLDFFQRAQRFSGYIGSAILMEIVEHDDHYLILGRWNPEVYPEQLEAEPGAHLLVEALAFSALGTIHELYGEPVPTQAVHLMNETHKDVIAAFAKSANAPIHNGDGFAGIELDKQVCLTTLPGANPQLARENDELLLEQLAAIGMTDVVHLCEQLIIDHLPQGDATLQLIAGQLNMSERVLQEKLRQAGQNFTGVLNRIKKTLAVQYLEEGKKNVSQIAYALGFDSPSNFARAFRGWTGSSPREFKTQTKT